MSQSLRSWSALGREKAATILHGQPVTSVSLRNGIIASAGGDGIKLHECKLESRASVTVALVVLPTTRRINQMASPRSSWPVSQDYNESIQTPAQCFVDAELQRGVAVTDILGMPVPCSGNFADVYPVVSGQRKWAVKCFTRQIPGLKERYTEISKYLARVQLPFVVAFSFLDRGIRVRNEWYPILKMEWIEGQPLNVFVAEQARNPATLQTLGKLWEKMASALRAANLAHGDLQHGNVLLVPVSKAGKLGIRLVDYDGMCVPALELLKATEVGHPAYQHPQRLREATYGLNIDNFSHLVIYTAIRALAVGGRKLWERYDNGDNLLFVQDDFEAPSKSPLFKELLGHSDGEVRKLAGALIDAARQPVQQTPRLEDVLPSGSRPKTKIPMQAAPQTAAASPVFPVATAFSYRQRQGGRRVVAAVLMAILVMTGIAVAAFALLHDPSPPSTTHVGPPTTPTSTQTTQIARAWLLLEITQVHETIPTITFAPPHAQVYLDGKLVAASCPRVWRLDVVPGRHELKVTQDGFKPFTAQVQVAAGKTERVAVRLVVQPLRVASYRSSFQGPTPARGWRYLRNASPIGDPKSYRPLLWDNKDKSILSMARPCPTTSGGLFICRAQKDMREQVARQIYLQSPPTPYNPLMALACIALCGLRLVQHTTAARTRHWRLSFTSTTKHPS